ncbi:hypothetical protein LTR70_008729 [Exophiala xenobiotica]|uniref:Uncharacterized protein n=1 Tax=Lithohypha guttulata TaxID=1690604 RepID=A0ABR0K1H2_9EURO|nr:hypothetical protein LTR24_008587 [Lithohypha guttulata]KAK5311502.1 hypothetical protein LTR70_008729 [Exophiala xenobiotica]
MAELPPLRLKAPSGGIYLPLRRIESMTQDEIQSLAFSPDIQPLVEKNGNLVSFGFDDIPLALIRAASPIIDMAFANLAPGERRKQIILPTNDTIAYAELFHVLELSLKARRPLKVATMHDHPIMAYRRIRIAAINLAMSTIADDLEVRTNGMLNPDLRTSTLKIPAADAEAVFNLYASTDALRIAVVGAVGRGLSCRRIGKVHFGQIKQLMKENTGIKDEVMAAKRKWDDKWEAGEDVYVRQ